MVTLSTEDQSVAQADLVSYLVFGRASSQIITGQGQQVGNAATGAFVDYVTGTFATQFSSALAQQVGLDYLNITRVGDYGVLQGTVESSFLPQVEFGQYISEDVFVVLIFRAPSDQGGAASNVFGGARVEVAMTDDYNFQAFWEDPFLRSNLGVLGQLNRSSKIVGVFIFREWGY